MASNQDQFCTTHTHLHLQYTAIRCTTVVVEIVKLVKGKEMITRMKTCSDTTHQEMEHLNSEQNKANFQLSQKFMCQKVAHPNDAMAEKRLIDLVDLEDAKEWFEVDVRNGYVWMFTINNPGVTGELNLLVPVAQDPCPSKVKTGNRKIKAQFDRHRTHNKQVVLRPYRMICSCAKIFGAKVISNVLVCSVSWLSVVSTDVSCNTAYDQEDILCPRSTQAGAPHI
jgi:hypothetical protein